MAPHGSGLDSGHLWLRYERYPYLLAKILTFGLVAYGLYSILAAVQDVLTPVLLALFLAYLLDPAVDWFESRGFSRTVGILLFLAIGGACIALFVLFLYPTVAHIIARITNGVPLLIDLLQHRTLPWLEREVLPRAGGWFGFEPDLDALLTESVDTLRGQLPQLTQRATRALAEVWASVGALVASLLNIVLVPVLTFYFLRDFDRMRLSTVQYLPVHNREWLLTRIASMDVVMGAWFRGQVQVAMILAGMYAFCLGLTFGLSGTGTTSGVAIGILAGLLNIVPYFGFLIGFVLSVLLALLDWTGTLWPLVGVLVTFAVVQGLEGYVVTPRIVGEKVGLSPVVVIIALLLGASLLGLLGVLLALPIAGVARVLLPDVVAWYRSSDLYTGAVPGIWQPPGDPEPPPLPVVAEPVVAEPVVAKPVEAPPVETKPVEAPPAEAKPVDVPKPPPGEAPEEET
jgi:predicted PurR-regulated permease PerM